MNTVIVADDDNDLLFIIKKFLESKIENLFVIIVNNGYDAVEKLKENFNSTLLIILDHHMGDLNGLQTYAAIREYYNDIPIILMSSDYNLITTIYNTDKYFAIIKKPLELSKLFNVVSKIIERNLNERTN